MNEIEHALARSLQDRAAEIDSDNLLFPSPSFLSSDGLAHKSRHHYLAIVSAVAVVIAVSVSIILATRPGDRQGVPSARAGAPYVGYKWQLVTIDQGNGVFAVPRGIDASIEFSAHHHLLLNDTVNATSGQYQIVDGGYRVDELFQTLVIGGDASPDRAKVVASMDVLTHTGLVEARFSAQLSTPTLTLTAGGIDLTFVLTGPAAEVPTPSATATTR